MHSRAPDSARGWPSTAAPAVLVALFLALSAADVQAQVFSSDRPGGVTLAPLGTKDSLNNWSLGTSGIVGCTGGPAFMLTVATQGSIFAVSDGMFDGMPYVWPIASMEDLGDALAGSSVYQINAVASTPSRDLIYVGFQPVAWTAAVPIVSVDLHGEVTPVVTSAELEEVAGPGAAVMALSVAPDETLYASMRSQVEGTLIEIHPDQPEGQRVSARLTTDDLLSELPAVSHDIPWIWGNSIASDGQGRVLFQADVVPEGGDDPLCVLIRLDPDGTLVEMTSREGEIPALPSYDFNVPDYPCQSTREGLVYDPVFDLVVGVGNGMWFLSPDEPGKADLVLQPFAIESLVYELIGPDYVNHQPSPAAPGNCLGFIGAQGVRVYGSMKWILYGVALDPLRLDLDRDLLLGEEEGVWGTDPVEADSDGGGLVDGAEVLDHTDPLDPADDRVLPSFSDRWSMSARFWGSRFWDAFAGTFNRYVVAKPDGSLLFSVWGNQPGRCTVARWTDWDHPAQMLSQGACESHQELDKDGNILCDYDTPSSGAATHPVDGSPAAPLVDPAVQDVLVGDSNVTGIAARPDGTRFVAYENGRLLRIEPDGSAALLYDSHEDLLKSGTIDENDGCFSCCTCSAPLGPIVYEPVRSIVYVWVNFTLYYGSTSLSPILVAVLPDNSLRIIVEADIFRPFQAQLGGQSIVDVEPDMSGGLWVLTTSGIDRSLARLDANMVLHTDPWFATPVGITGPGGPGDIPWWALAHADDIAVTPDGRVFLLPMYSYEQYPPAYFPSELISVEPVVRAGDILSVHPQEKGLGKLDPRGGGINLVFEGDLQRPVSVAGTVEKVVVADADRHELLVYELKKDGSLKKPAPLGQIQEPGGIDIDADGSILVVDRAAKSVLRVESDGTQTPAVQGNPFADPRDVVALRSGELAVSDNSAGSIFLVGADRVAKPVASAPGADALTVIDGLAWVVSTPADKLPPLRIASDGQTRLGSKVPQELAYLDNPGGMSADLEGNVFWIVWGGFHFDSVYNASQTRVLRLTPDGYMSPMVRSGLPSTQTPGDVYVVRSSDAQLPRLPGEVEPPPPFVEAVDGADVATHQDIAPADTIDGSPSPSTSGGCSAAPIRSARFSRVLPAAGLLALICFLGFLALVRYGRFGRHKSAGDATSRELCRSGRHKSADDATSRELCRSGRHKSADVLAPALGLLLLLGLVSLPGCSSPRTPSPGDVTTDGGAEASVGDARYAPETIPPECKGKDLCPPGIDPVCAGPTSSRSCHLDQDGCYVWSKEIVCPGGVACKDGMCQICFPNCRGLQCGDDGCGGSCGECAAPETCCNGFCAPCKVDCSGKACGDDGTGGTCGKCPANFVCSKGKCFQPGTGTCVDYFECSSSCPEWSDPCWEDCESYASDQARYQATLLNACTLEQCAPCLDMKPRDKALECLDECALEYCSAPHDACVNDIPPNT